MGALSLKVIKATGTWSEMCGRDLLQSSEGETEFTARLARRGMKDQADTIWEEGCGAGSHMLGAVVLFTKSSTSVGSQVSAGGAEREAGPAHCSWGGCGGDGAKERWAGQNVLMRGGKQVHQLLEGVSGRKREGARNREDTMGARFLKTGGLPVLRPAGNMTGKE